MVNLKASLFTILCQFSNVIPLEKLIQWSGKTLFSPFYHAVSESPLPHIQNLYKVRTPGQFLADIEFLQAHFKPISYHDLLRSVKGEKPVETPSFFLSFDDGLREVYDVVTPILIEKKIPATVFLNPHFIDNRALMFRYKASLVINDLRTADYEILKSIASIWETPTDFLKIKSEILKLGYSDELLIDQIAAISGTNFQSFLDNQKPYLTTSQIRSMADSGLFTFASHSLDHPLYKDLSINEQVSQTRDSLAWLNEQSYETQNAFAFPFTDDEVKPLFFETMFESGVLDISFGSAGLKVDEFEGHHLQRFPMEGPNLSANKLIPAEYLYFLLKRMLGRGQVRR